MKTETPDLNKVLAPQPDHASTMLEIERSKAIQQVQAAILTAKRFPRDRVAARSEIIEACKRKTLADVATYSFPRGKDTVKGETIRFAEMVAHNWGNLDFGIKEIERLPGRSLAEAFCWDMERNVRKTITFEVPHEIEIGRGVKTMKKLTDPRDIRERVMSDGSRIVRNCIFAIIPSEVLETARRQIRETLLNGDGRPMADRLLTMVEAFKPFGVSKEMIEIRLKHKLEPEITTREELLEMHDILNALREKEAKRGDFFALPDGESDDIPTEGVSEKSVDYLAKLKGNKDVTPPAQEATADEDKK